jgi:hypothetical protein
MAQCGLWATKSTVDREALCVVARKKSKTMSPGNRKKMSVQGKLFRDIETFIMLD